MISKEDKKILESYVRDFDERNKYGVAFREDLLKLAIENVLSDIQQLETKQQKVIDYLEKEKYTIESTYSQISGNYFMAQDRLDLINRVLEIMKGEE